MTRDEMLTLADSVFDEIMGDPEDANNKIISGRRGNSAEVFNPEPLIAAGEKNAAKRVRHAQEALEQFGPGIDRIKG